MLLRPQPAFDFFFQTSPEFSSQRSSPKYCFGFLKFSYYDFSHFFFLRKFHFQHCARETKNCSYIERSHRRANPSEIWASSVKIFSVYKVPLIIKYSRCIAIFDLISRNICIVKRMKTWASRGKYSVYIGYFDS